MGNYHKSLYTLHQILALYQRWWQALICSRNSSGNTFKLGFWRAQSNAAHASTSLKATLSFLSMPIKTPLETTL